MLRFGATIADVGLLLGGRLRDRVISGLLEPIGIYAKRSSGSTTGVPCQSSI